MKKKAPSPFGYKDRAFFEATRGRLFDVEDATAVFGAGLDYDAAAKRLNEVTSSGKSRTASIYYAEDAPAAPAAAAPAEVPPAVPAAAPPTAAPGLGVSYALDHAGTSTVPADGTIERVAPGHELLVNGAQTQVPCRVKAKDVVVARPLDPEIAAAQARALHAVSTTIHQPAKGQPRYLDVTVKAPAPRTTPPPADVTAGSEVFVRLAGAPESAAEPLPSPLDPELDDLPDLDGGDVGPNLFDITADLGGGASDADIAHAKAQAQDTGNP